MRWIFDGPLIPSTDIVRKVIISYIMQLSLLLGAYVAQSLSRSWVKGLTLPFFVIRHMCRRMYSLALETAYEESSDLQARLRFPRQVASLVASLVEFQKTQVFFIITVEVAVLIALYNGKYVNASSWQQWWNNVSFMQDIGYSGLEPVVFGMFLLRKADKLSWYVTVASTCCVFVSTFTIVKSGEATIQPRQINNEISLDACQGQAPIQHCLEDRSSQGLNVSAQHWVVSPFILGFMILEKIANDRPIMERLSRCHPIAVLKVKWQAVRSPKIAQRLQDVKEHMLMIIVPLIELWFVVNISRMIMKYILWLPVGSTTRTNGTWPLGQIIAVAVWVPVIVELIYLLARKSAGPPQSKECNFFNNYEDGIEKGSLYRLVRPYQVLPSQPRNTGNASMQPPSLAPVEAAIRPSSSPSPNDAHEHLLPSRASDQSFDAQMWSSM